ncbi:cellulase family glycosylhydrolase [Natronobiforma cellulositropha]|uniref:cellulase family glycosylhydrolase n=1 Tax=Natronobiforma cellulositropha TaxID=1679076 RepID=UPI0021D5EAD9|nr:cellulase family glycosylhydrolase [Natronobiforma cellulositropha]
MDVNNTQQRSDGSTRRTFLKAAGTGLGGLAIGGLSSSAGAVGIPTPRLHTEGKWIVDPDGNPVTLRGFATAGLGYMSYDWYPRTVEEVLNHAVDGETWHPNMIRLPCGLGGIRDYGGIEPFVEEVLRPAVDLLYARGVYAMIDFHLIMPYTQEAIDDYNEETDEDDQYDPIDEVMEWFWDVVAPEFADDEHVLYELFNEPTYPYIWDEYGQEVDREESWLLWRDVAQPWVDLVREHAPETPIVIGSPGWTSETQWAPEYPFEGENLVYASHIYPANGDPDEFDEEYGAPAEEVPVICTEFGWDPDSWDVDEGSTTEWGAPFREWMDSYENMGWQAWCFDDTWAPTFFDSPDEGVGVPWELKDDEEQMGWFIREWLAETRDDGLPADQLGDDVPPEPPSDLTVTRAAEIAADLEWEPATDPGDAGVVLYNVFLDGEFSHDVVAASGTETTIDGLEPGRSYEVTVTAVDRVGNESDEAAVTVDTIPYGTGQTPFDGPNEVPGRIQAEDFDEGGPGTAYSVTADSPADTDYRETTVPLEENGTSGYNIGFLDTGEWWEYTVDVETSGTYDISVNVASENPEGGALRVELDREEVASTTVWHTGGWADWTEVRVGAADIPAGRHIVRVSVEADGWNFDWLEFDLDEAHDDFPDEPDAPSNLTSPAQTETSVDLAWDAVEDADTYAVYVDGSLDHEVDGLRTSTTVEGLSAGTAYVAGVSAIGTDGAASPLETISVSTEGGEDSVDLDVTGDGNPAGDLTGDGLYEDVTGDGQLGFNDVVTFFEEHDGDVVQSNVEYFDFSGSGSVGFNDVVALFERL